MSGPNLNNSQRLIAKFQGIVLTSTPTLRRMLFDLSFFVWVGVLLFNLVAGLIFDAFNSIRGEADARDETLAESCFVCGFARKDYDNCNLPPEYPNFDEHKDVNHGIWRYIYYIDYLNDKDPTEFTGVEQYVKEQLDKNEMLWVPFRSAFAIQNHSVHQKMQVCACVRVCVCACVCV